MLPLDVSKVSVDCELSEYALEYAILEIDKKSIIYTLHVAPEQLENAIQIIKNSISRSKLFINIESDPVLIGTYWYITRNGVKVGSGFQEK